MQQEKINKKLAALFWALTAICMAVIFYFSSRTATISASQSAIILDFLKRVFGDGALTDFIVRKSAHFLEFTGLSLLFNCALYFTKGNKQLLLSIALTSLYAVTDEIHQIFIEGRSCELRDWGIDTLGAVLGAIIFILLFEIIKRIIKRKQK